jgi:hypothetical protein
MLKISQSKIKAWRQCRRKYHYSEVENLQRKRVPRPLKFGDLMHRMQDIHVAGEDHRKAIDELSIDEMNLFEQEREEYGNIIQDSLDIMAGYIEYYKNDGIKPIKFRGNYAEHEMEIKLTETIRLTGKIDWIVRTRNKRSWLSDHKTGKKQMSDSQMWRNVQSTVYHRMWEELGEKPLDGTMWDLIWSKPPTAPKLKKDGEVSRAALVTLPVVVRRFLKAHKGVSDEDAKALLDIARECEPRYYSRVFMPRNPQVERMLINDFTVTAREIERGHGKRKGRNLDWHCDSCQFNNLCQAKLLGLDYDFVKRTQYVKDAPRGGSKGFSEEDDED